MILSLSTRLTTSEPGTVGRLWHQLCDAANDQPRELAHLVGLDSDTDVAIDLVSWAEPPSTAAIERVTIEGRPPLFLLTSTSGHLSLHDSVQHAVDLAVDGIGSGCLCRRAF